MAGFKFEVGIKKGIRIIKDAERFAARKKVLEATAAKIQAEARRLSRQRMGDIAPGHVTGNLQASIKVEKLNQTSPQSWSIRVYSDPDVAVSKPKKGDPGGFHYGPAQEYGTGEYGVGPEATGEPIRPKGRKFFVWLQKGKPYRGKHVQAFVTKGEYVTKPLARPRRGRKTYREFEGSEWQQRATEIHGAKPKLFLSRAFTPQMQAEHRAAIAATNKILDVIG